MSEGHDTDHDGLKRILDRNRDIHERLPVRVPGYPAPMVPLTLEERDDLLRAWTDREMDAVRKPLVIRTGEPNLDAMIEAVMPEQLYKRDPVMVDGYPQAMVLLTCDERHLIIQALIRLGGRVRELGDARSLRQQLELARDLEHGFSESFTDTIIDTMGLEAVPDIIDTIIARLEQTADPLHHENANLLREVRARYRVRSTIRN